MMRAVRERPRVAAVTALGAVALMLCGAALGALLAGGGAEIPQTAQVRLASAHQATREQTRLLDAARVEVAEAHAALARQTRRSRELPRTNARQQHKLRQARRGAPSERRRRSSRSGSAG
jgi:hypothetical protein